MKKRILSALLIISIVFGSNASIVFAKENNKGVVSKENYQNKLLDNDTLYKKAEKGDLVNDEYTQVSTSYENNGTTKVTKINKKLSKEVYNDGTIVEDYSTELSFAQILPDNRDLAAAYITAPGNKTETGTSGSYTVQVTVTMNYEKMSVDNGVNWAYKVISMSAKPILLDGLFSMTKLYQYVDGSGQGYTSTGTPTYVNDPVVSNTITNPVSGVTYSKNTGYTNYVQVSDGSGKGITTTITYKRISTGVVYTYTYGMSLGA